MTNYLRSPDVILSCDGPSCLQLPDKAPRVFVPSKTPTQKDHAPLTLAFPHLHYCVVHWETHMKLDDLLTDKVKARFEDQARRVRPHDFVCDFDAALVQPIDVHSPEYGAYMARIGLKTDGLGYEIHQTLKKRLSGAVGFL